MSSSLLSLPTKLRLSVSITTAPGFTSSRLHCLIFLQFALLLFFLPSTFSLFTRFSLFLRFLAALRIECGTPLGFPLLQLGVRDQLGHGAFGKHVAPPRSGQNFLDKFRGSGFCSQALNSSRRQKRNRFALVVCQPGHRHVVLCRSGRDAYFGLNPSDELSSLEMLPRRLQIAANVDQILRRLAKAFLYSDGLQAQVRSNLVLQRRIVKAFARLVMVSQQCNVIMCVHGASRS